VNWPLAMTTSAGSNQSEAGIAISNAVGSSWPEAEIISA